MTRPPTTPRRPPSPGTAAATDLSPLAKETVMPDLTGTHRPIRLYYATPQVSVVPEPIGDRPTVRSHIDTSVLQASATLTAGPLQLRFPDAETARFWASAMEELAAQLAIAEDQAADLRNTEMHAATDDDELADAGPNADYDVLNEIEYEAQDHADDAALAANDEIRKG